MPRLSTKPEVGQILANNHALATSRISERQCVVGSCSRRKNGVAWLKSLWKIVLLIGKEKGGLETRPLGFVVWPDWRLCLESQRVCQAAAVELGIAQVVVEGTGCGGVQR